MSLKISVLLELATHIYGSTSGHTLPRNVLSDDGMTMLQVKANLQVMTNKTSPLPPCGETDFLSHSNLCTVVKENGCGEKGCCEESLKVIEQYLRGPGGVQGSHIDFEIIPTNQNPILYRYFLLGDAWEQLKIKPDKCTVLGPIISQTYTIKK